MRKIVAISALSVLAAGSVAAGVVMLRAPGGTMTADLERDLSLATSVQSTRTGVVSAIEQGRNGAPSGSAKGVRMVVPTKKKAPAPAVAQTVAEVPLAPADVSPEPAPMAPPDVSVPTTAAAAVAENAIPAAAPDPHSAEVNATGGPSAGSSNEGAANGAGSGSAEGRNGGARGVMGGIIGVVLRGGFPGEDNCLPPGRRTGRGTNGEAIGGIGGIGGVIATRGGIPAGSLPGGGVGGPGRRW